MFKSPKPMTPPLFPISCAADRSFLLEFSVGSILSLLICTDLESYITSVIIKDLIIPLLQLLS